MSSHNRIEAQRCKEIAEKLINSEDYMGARDKLYQARKLLPSFENIDSMLAVCDILSAASLEFPGCKVDYYWVLQLKPNANEVDLRTQSHKLVSLLQPIKKGFPGTELALQLVKAAFVMLSDKEKRLAFDLRRVESWDTCGAVLCQDFVFDLGVVNKEGVVSAQSSSGNKRVSMCEASDGSDGHDVAREKLLKKMKYCDEPPGENAMEVDKNDNTMCSLKHGDEGKPSSTYHDFGRNRKEECFEVGQIWAAQHQEKFPERYARINLVSNSELSITWLKPIPFMEYERRWCETGLPVACGSFELDPDADEEKVHGPSVFSQLCSWVHGVTHEQVEVYPNKGEVWAVFEDWDLAEWATDLEIMNCCRFKIVEVLSDYSKYMGALVACLVKVEGFTSIFKREVDEGDYTSFRILPNSLYMFSHIIPAHRLKGGEMDSIEEGMLELDPLALLEYVVNINSSDEHSPSNISSVIDAPEYIPPMRSSNKQSLKINWSRNDFSIGQVWAVYSGNDAMPRRHALINSVISNTQVCATFLEPHPVHDYEIYWDKEKLPIVCGIFRVGKSIATFEMSLFSHSVKCQRSKNQSYYRIYPRKGEVWAMYTNWNKKWKQSDFNNCQYRVVEILEDFSEGSGVKVARLTEVKGCMTFFHRHRHDGFELVRVVSKSDLLSFSHRIPAFTVPGIERYDIPNSSLHLEPDAIPPRPKK